MDHQKEYHDPDYPEISGSIKEESISLNEVEKVEKIQCIVRQEFSTELEAREGEVMLLDQRMSSSRRLLHRLRYSIVSGYYRQQKLQLSAAQLQDDIVVANPTQQTVLSVESDGQRRIHPSVRKLIGKKSVDLDEILLGSRAPRHNARKDYCAMLQSRNYTIAADSTKTLRPGSQVHTPEPERPRKVPRHQQPRIDRVLTLDEATRNQTKHRYRVIIGNTSKYAPGASQQDPSTHKWLLYVRGVDGNDLCGPVLTAVIFRLHHSYAPHHNVHLLAPPFHISRRGWGEFLARIEMHFAMPERNKPVIIEHTIKLDRNYTGLQTLGAETIVDVWLYSTQEMLKYEHTETENHTNHTKLYDDIQIPLTEPANIKMEDQSDCEQNEHVQNEHVQENWLDFFSNTSELDVDEMFIKPMKKIEQIENFEQNDFVHTLKKKPNCSIQELCSNEQNDIVYDQNDVVYEQNDFVQKRNEQNDFVQSKRNEHNDFVQKKNEHKGDMENLIEPSFIKKEIVENVTENDQIDESKEARIDISRVKKEVDWPSVCHSQIDDVMQDLPNELLIQSTSPKKRIMKYMDPTTGKIYYLEMDRNLDLSKVQEIVINSKGIMKTAKISPIKPNGLKNVRKNTKKGVSLLRPEVKNLLKKEETVKENSNSTKFTNNSNTVKSFSTRRLENSKKEFTHIDNDHCYLGYNFQMPHNTVLPTQNSVSSTIIEEAEIKKEKSLFDFVCGAVKRFCSVRTAVNYLLKKIPIITSEARDPDYVKHFPFVVESEERYWKLDFAKRRNIEWSRAKLINKMLTEHFPNSNDPIWRTKQILIFSRLYGYYPIRTETMLRQTSNENNFTSWDTKNSNTESNIKEIYRNPDDICTLSNFDIDIQNMSDSIVIDSDEEIDIIQCDQPKKIEPVLPDTSKSLQVLPVENEEDRLRFLYIERKCADIGIELRNENVGNGYSYSAVHAALLSAVRCFAEELIRGALADKLNADRKALALPPVWTGSSSWRAPIRLENVLASARQPRMTVIDLSHLGTQRKDHYAI